MASGIAFSVAMILAAEIAIVVELQAIGATCMFNGTIWLGKRATTN